MKFQPKMKYLLVSPIKDPLMLNPDSKIILSGVSNRLACSLVEDRDPECHALTPGVGDVVWHNREHVTEHIIRGKVFGILHENSIIGSIPANEIDGPIERVQIGEEEIMSQKRRAETNRMASEMGLGV